MALSILRRARLIRFTLAMALAAGCSSSGETGDRAAGPGNSSRERDSGTAAIDAAVVVDAAVPDDGAADGGIVSAKPLVDLYAFQMWGAASGKCEVNILSGADDYKTFKRKAHGTFNSTPPNGSIEMLTGDLNADGFTDLYFLGRVETNAKVTEIHVMDGKSTYGSLLLAVATGFAYAGVDRRWTFRVGDYNRDKKLDLWGIAAKDTGSNKIEVHVVDGNNNLATFIEHTATTLPATDEAHVPFFAIADADKDGTLDLYSIAGNATGSTEVVS